MNDNIKAGAEIHAGDGGYAIGTRENYDAFVRVRNASLARMRVREFEKESGMEIYGLGAKRERWEATLEAFAQLVAKDCALIAGIMEHERRENIGACILDSYGISESGEVK